MRLGVRFTISICLIPLDQFFQACLFISLSFCIATFYFITNSITKPSPHHLNPHYTTSHYYTTPHHFNPHYTTSHYHTTPHHLNPHYTTSHYYITPHYLNSTLTLNFFHSTSTSHPTELHH